MSHVSCVPQLGQTSLSSFNLLDFYPSFKTLLKCLFLCELPPAPLLIPPSFPRDITPLSHHGDLVSPTLSVFSGKV